MNMAKENKKKYISNLLESHKKLDLAFEDIFKIFGSGVIESEFWESIYSTFDTHLQTVKDVVGDKDDWIEWYLYDNDYGKKEFEAGYDSNLKPVKTIDDLLELIELGNNRDSKGISTNS